MNNKKRGFNSKLTLHKRTIVNLRVDSTDLNEIKDIKGGTSLYGCTLFTISCSLVFKCGDSYGLTQCEIEA